LYFTKRWNQRKEEGPQAISKTGVKKKKKKNATSFTPLPASRREKEKRKQIKERKDRFCFLRHGDSEEEGFFNLLWELGSSEQVRFLKLSASMCGEGREEKRHGGEGEGGGDKLFILFLHELCGGGKTGGKREKDPP